MSESDSLKIVGLGLIVGLLAAFSGMVALMLLIPGFPLTDLVHRLFNWIFGLDTVQSMWYITRAAGLVAYLLLWLSTAWGLAVSSKIFDVIFHRSFTYDMHQYISLLAIGFTALHIIVLLADQYLPFNVFQVLIPFIAPYRPVWVAFGIIGLYLTLLVTVTFYIRRWIGQKTFRVIHIASFAAYAGVTIHGLMAGTDSALLSMQLIYAGTALVIVFLTVYWFVMLPRNKSVQPIAPAPIPTPAYRRR